MEFIEHLRRRSPLERTFHAISYELVGILTSTPVVALLSGKPVGESGILATVVAIIAMAWNYLFNYVFDKLQARYGFARTFWVRLLHGAGFEVGLIALTVPVIALIFAMSLVHAFLLEAGMLIYFFPYTIVFNWAYDKVRLRLIHRENTGKESGAANSEPTDAP